MDFVHWILLSDSMHLFYLEKLSQRSSHLAVSHLTGRRYNLIAPRELVEDVDSLLTKVNQDDIAAYGGAASALPSAARPRLR